MDALKIPWGFQIFCVAFFFLLETPNFWGAFLIVETHKKKANHLPTPCDLLQDSVMQRFRGKLLSWRRCWQIFPEDNQLFWRWIFWCFLRLCFFSHVAGVCCFFLAGHEIWDMGSWLYKSSWQKLTVTWLYRDHWNPIPVSRAEILYIWCLTAERLVGTKRILCSLPCCAPEIYACWI